MLLFGLNIPFQNEGDIRPFCDIKMRPVSRREAKRRICHAKKGRVTYQ